jgi:TolB-like protein
LDRFAAAARPSAYWALLVPAPHMVSEQDRVPLPTEVSPLETDVDLQPSDCHQPETAGDEQLTLGQKLSGRYRIERELGEGGMGVVYLVADEEVVGETFAIKVLKEGLDPETLSLLREEVRKTRKLSHPNIVDVHSVNVDGTRLYVLMEYLEGKSLIALLDEDFGRGMPFGRAWPIIEDVGAALGYAHDHSVIHSDLKPANIFLTTSGKTKLLDFGIARVSRGPLLHRRSGPLALTPAYASCETLQRAEADARDDIYSFACVIYEMLSGKRPFGELNALEAREAGAQVPPLAMLSREQNAALVQALAFDRDRRTSSVEEVLQGLAADRKPRRRPVAVLGAAIIAAGAAVGLTYLVLDKLWVPRHSAVVQSVAPQAQQAAAPAAPSTVFNPPPRSIAVLPFTDMSERHNQEYFSDGLSEELIDRLSQSDDLRVIARTSSFYFKHRQATVAEIARTLNVNHILEGSVRKSGNMVRITAQLVRSSDGSHVWSRTYDRKLVDILKVQDEIAGTVALALKAALASTSPARQSEAASRAYNLILEGDFFFRRHEEGDPEHGTDLYRQAMQLDPKNARARIAFAEAILHLADHDLVPADTAARQAMEAAQEALSIDSSFVPAHRLIAKIERDVNWNWTRALAELERARSLPSSVSDGRDVMEAIEYIRALKSGIYSKRYEKLLREDLEADPLSGGTMRELARVLTASNRLQEALLLRSRHVQLSPNAMDGKAELGLQLMYLNRYEDALSVAKADPDDFWKLRALTCIHWAMGRRAESDRELAEFAKVEPGSLHSYFMANVHAFRGERDEAFKWLDRAYKEHSSYLPELNLDPMLTSLRGDPRFHDLQVKLRLTN